MNLDTYICKCGSKPVGAINYERHQKLRRDAWEEGFEAGRQCALKAEARVKVLEEALRKIAKGEYHNEEEDYQLDSQCRCADALAESALAAKEKP